MRCLEQTSCQQVKQRSWLSGHPAAHVHTLTQLPPHGRRADEKYTDEQEIERKKLRWGVYSKCVYHRLYINLQLFDYTTPPLNVKTKLCFHHKIKFNIIYRVVSRRISYQNTPNLRKYDKVCS